MTLLYLFYFQARKQLTEEVRGRKRHHRPNDTELFADNAIVKIDVRDDDGETLKMPATQSEEHESLMTPHSPQTTDFIGKT